MRAHLQIPLGEKNTRQPNVPGNKSVFLDGMHDPLAEGAEQNVDDHLRYEVAQNQTGKNVAIISPPPAQTANTSLKNVSIHRINVPVLTTGQTIAASTMAI